ncbi:MAG: hypothetical protein ACRDN0_38465, partial [Trebonia sp.]
MTAGPLAAGFVTSGGVLLVVAGLGKVYASARRRDDGDAVRRVLRLGRGQWRVLAGAVAVIECCVGVAVCAGTGAGTGAGTDPVLADSVLADPVLGDPVPACAAMAALGAVFCALLAYARVRRVPGGCGCLGWGPGRPLTARPVTV